MLDTMLWKQGLGRGLTTDAEVQGCTFSSLGRCKDEALTLSILKKCLQPLLPFGESADRRAGLPNHAEMTLANEDEQADWTLVLSSRSWQMHACVKQVFLSDCESRVLALHRSLPHAVTRSTAAQLRIEVHVISDAVKLASSFDQAILSLERDCVRFAIMMNVS